MTSIYALIDPRTDEIRYVGKTKDPEGRLLHHIREAKLIRLGSNRRKINRRYAWILSVIDAGSEPRIRVLELTDQPNDRERFWIRQFPNLTNMTEGGDGGDTNSGRKFGPRNAQQRKSIAAGTRAAMSNSDVRAKCSAGARIMLSKIKDADGRLRSDIRAKIAKWNRIPIRIRCHGQILEFDSIQEFQRAWSINGNRWNRKIKPGLDPHFLILPNNT